MHFSYDQSHARLSQNFLLLQRDFYDRSIFLEILSNVNSLVQTYCRIDYFTKTKKRTYKTYTVKKKNLRPIFEDGEKNPFYILAPFIKLCNAEIYVCPRLGEVWSVCNQSRKPDNSHLNISMTSLVEHSDTQPTECRLCLKFWCLQSNVCFLGLGLTCISMS